MNVTFGRSYNPTVPHNQEKWQVLTDLLMYSHRKTVQRALAEAMLQYVDTQFVGYCIKQGWLKEIQ